jgi:hypothetical protein
MLDLTGRLADGWLVSVPHTPPAALAGGHARIDAAAAAAGRDPAAVRRGYNVPDDLTDPAGLVERLLAFHAEHRMDTLVLSPVGDPLRAAEVFLAEVVPVVQATQRRVPSDGGSVNRGGRRREVWASVAGCPHAAGTARGEGWARWSARWFVEQGPGEQGYGSDTGIPRTTGTWRVDHGTAGIAAPWLSR